MSKVSRAEIRIPTLLFIVASLVVPLSSSAAEDSPANDTGSWIPSIFVLLANDTDHQKSEDIIRRIKDGERSGHEIDAFNSESIKGVRRMALEGQYSPREVRAGEKEVARSKLGRFVVIDVDNKNSAQEIVEALSSDPAVEYVTLDRLIPSVSTDVCTASPTVVPYTQFSKTWGQERVRRSQGTSKVNGHAYVGVIDLGVEMAHRDLRDFSQGNYDGGNFHPHIAIDIGGRVLANGSRANPFTAQGIFGEVDEYFVPFVTPDPQDGYPDDLTCDEPPDGNDNGYIESIFAGHGTHVFGIIGANNLNSDSAKGICKNCPITVIRMGVTAACFYGNQDITGQPHEGFNNALTFLSSAAAVAFAIDIGVQVINLSSGSPAQDDPPNVGVTPDWCDINPNDPYCLTIEYAEDRDVVWVAAAGNANHDTIDFPASDSRVIGVSGQGLDRSRWSLSTTCGSNYGGAESTGPSFMAPSEAIYSTMYADMNWIPGGCHEYNDDDGVGTSELGDGFGYCSGTSMGTPFVSGVAAQVKSINPLLSEDEVFEALKQATPQVRVFGYPWDDELGWGIVKSDFSVIEALGYSNGVQVKNRTIPLFDLFGSTGNDYINTTKPQVALAFTLNTSMGVNSVGASPQVDNFSFAEAAANNNSQTPRAEIFVLSSHVTPVAGSPLEPIYRMRFIGAHGGNSQNTDWAIARSSEINSFHSVGYLMDGVEGYIYSTCTPEPSCIPQGATKLYRAYNPAIDDHAVFPEALQTAKINEGYDNSLTLLGYAYPNIDTDGDGLIDGMEYVIGTDPSDTDSDNDGQSDGAEYPLADLPVSDPGL